MNIKEMTS